ncbi:MAG: terminase gpA endonuclease subunit [Lutibacter sp.]
MNYKYKNNLMEIVLAGLMLFKIKELPPIMDWAETKINFSKEESSRPGLWDRTTQPFLNGIFNAFMNPMIERITLMCSSQIGKTEIIKIIISYIVDNIPGARILLIYPDDGDARNFSNEKFEAMVRSNKWLQQKLAPTKSNSKDNKTLYKKILTGGFIAITGSRVSQDLSSRSIMFVIADDRSRITVAGTEGNSVELGWQRTESYALLGRKLIEISTPTIIDECPTEESYKKSNQTEYHVPCPHCGGYQMLEFGTRDSKYGLKWDKDYDLEGNITKHYPETTKYQCHHCEKMIEEKHKHWMLTNGKEYVKHPEIKNHYGLVGGRLYSTFSTWSTIVKYFLDKKDKPEDLQVVYNTVFGLPFRRDKTIELDTTGLLERCEDYLTDKNDYRIANEVLVLVLIADMQPDRLEYQVIGFGLQNEPWQIEYSVLYGDVDQDDVWNDLEAVQQKKWKREDGVELGIHYRPGWDFPVFIDSGGTGSNTQSCYKQCKKRYYKGWMPIKGEAGDDKPILLNVSNVGAAKDIHLQKIGVDAAKNTIHKMLRTNESPVKMHFTKAFANLQYFEQLTSERKIKELNKRTNRHHWIWKKKSPHARNEVLDIWAYALACILKLNPRYIAIEKRLKEKAIDNTKENVAVVNMPLVEQNKKIIKRKVLARRRV